MITMQDLTAEIKEMLYPKASVIVDDAVVRSGSNLEGFATIYKVLNNGVIVNGFDHVIPFDCVALYFDDDVDYIVDRLQ